MDASGFEKPPTSLDPATLPLSSKFMGGVIFPPGIAKLNCPAPIFAEPPFEPSTCTLPSSPITLKPPEGLADVMKVVPRTEAVAPALLMRPPPLPFGALNRTLPCARFTSRLLASTEKMVFDPTRVTVLSSATSSARESGPVLMTFGATSTSPTLGVDSFLVAASITMTSFTMSVKVRPWIASA